MYQLFRLDKFAGVMEEEKESIQTPAGQSRVQWMNKN